jgi:hypothetical protein
MKCISLGLAALSLLLIGGPAHSQSSDFIVSNVYIDNVRQPRNVLDIARDCVNNKGCALFLNAVDNYFQLPISRTVSVAAALAPTHNGEGTYVHSTLPSGYAYCKATMKMTSIVPYGGPRGSLFMAMSKPDGLYYETWTPRLPPTEGRSWVEAGVSIVGVRQDLAASARANGTCYGPERVLWYCRGGGCTDTEDRGQSKDSSSPPAAMSAK